MATKDLTSGKTRYSFLYSKNTSFGKLSTVTDSAGNKIQFLRDYSNVVSSIENTQDHKSELKISGVGFLERLSEKGRAEITLGYDSDTGLLTSRSGVSRVVYAFVLFLMENPRENTSRMDFSSCLIDLFEDVTRYGTRVCTCILVSLYCAIRRALKAEIVRARLALRVIGLLFRVCRSRMKTAYGTCATMKIIIF